MVQLVLCMWLSGFPLLFWFVLFNFREGLPIYVAQGHFQLLSVLLPYFSSAKIAVTSHFASGLSPVSYRNHLASEPLIVGPD